MAETLEVSEEAKMERVSRAEIDTSAPFESVKEAACRFGGIGFWKPSSHIPKISHPKSDTEALDIVQLEEQALFLEKDLILKERETLDVLKELENTKSIMEDLKQKLLKEASQEAEKENHETNCPPPAPGFILMELKQAKLNLGKTTADLVEIRSSVDLFNKKLEKERLALERTRDRLAQNSLKIVSLEEELCEAKVKMESAKESESGESCGGDNPVEISKELQRLSSEVEQFKRVGEAARSEVSRATREIEQTKNRIKTAETRLVAARKMKEAARAAEAIALAEIKAVSNPGNDRITLSYEEYSTLVRRARDAEEASEKKVADATQLVDDAEFSNVEILKKVEEATEEVKTSKMAIEEALSRVEAANQGKLAVEEALRRWRSDHRGQRRRSSVNNSTKFKNSSSCLVSSSHHRRDSRLLDVNGLNLINDELTPVLKPTLSIGQILSRKLLPPEEFEHRVSGKSHVKPKVSLGQMLSKKNGEFSSSSSLSSMKVEKENNGGHKQFSGKRKKFGFARFSTLLVKQSKKKKKTSLNLR